MSSAPTETTCGIPGAGRLEPVGPGREHAADEFVGQLGRGHVEHAASTARTSASIACPPRPWHGRPAPRSRAREQLEGRGYEVLVFHATGTGGKAMEALVDVGLPGRRPRRDHDRAVRRPRRRRVLGRPRPAGGGRPRHGLPQVVSLGALDMVNFGARDSVPPQFEDRNLYVHNPSVTLMRTTPDECASWAGASRASSRGRPGRQPVRPSRGVSMIDAEGQPFHDPEADAALFDALREGLAGSSVELDRARQATSTTPRSPPRSWTSSTHTSGPLDDRRRGLAPSCARRSTARRPIIGAGAGTGHLRQVRRGRRHRPDHHLQLGPLPDGRPRLAGRADALRRRQRDRHGHGPRGPAGRPGHAGARRRLRHRPVPADAALPARAPGAGFAGVQNFPTVGPDRRHVPRRTSRRPAWASAWRSR